MERPFKWNGFSRAERGLVEQRAEYLDGILPRYSRNSREVLLRPDVMPVMLGIKGAYIPYEDEPQPELLMAESDSLPGFNGLFTTACLQNILFDSSRFTRRIIREGSLLKEYSAITDEQIQGLSIGVISNAWIAEFDKWCISNELKELKFYAAHGFLIGYSAHDIRFEASSCGKNNYDANLLINLFGIMANSADPKRTAGYLEKWQEAARFAYNVLKHHKDFWEDFDTALRGCENWLFGRPEWGY